MVNERVSESQGRERRQHPRVPCEWNLTLSLADSAGSSREEPAVGLTLEAKVRDISRAGVCFYLERPVPMMTLLRLELDLPGTDGPDGPHRIAGSGAVVRCEKISQALEHYEIAVFMHDMAESDREAIDLFVKSSEGQASRAGQAQGPE